MLWLTTSILILIMTYTRLQIVQPIIAIRHGGTVNAGLEISGAAGMQMGIKMRLFGVDLAANISRGELFG